MKLGRLGRLAPATGLSSALSCALPLAFLVAAAALAYWPGLSGDFLFDDYVNLNALGRYGGVDSWETLLYYLTSGIADPTGRPVSLASFLLDATDWPADPWPFKRTNLVIHLINAVLLYSVLVALGTRLSKNSKHARMAALMATAMWLLHPLWASTVLYVIQRQAMLAATFVLIGIRLWIASVDSFASDRTGRGWLLALLAGPFFGLLAGLSKANGFLLPLLLCALHFTVLRGKSDSARGWWRNGRGARTLLATAPALLIVLYLLWIGLDAFMGTGSSRPWTIGERLLSQPRALCEYLRQLLVPGLSATGVFADAFQPSRGWLEPWTTLPAALLISGALALAVLVRRTAPVLAAAVLFFFAGHAMESSVVMLELYFEHRNYLPAMLLFWPLTWWLTKPGRYLRWRMFAGIGYTILMLAALTIQAQLWSDPLALARTWAYQNPQSARAQTHAALMERNAGDSAAAEARLAQALAERPGEPQFALGLLNLRCSNGTVSASDVAATAHAIRASNGLALDLTHQWLANTLLPGSDSDCAVLLDAPLAQLLDSAMSGVDRRLISSREMQSRKKRLQAHLALRQDDCSRALDSFDRRIELQPRPEFVSSQTALLATHCGDAVAHSHLKRYLDAGAPVSRASSPALRLRDRIMAHTEFWGLEWQRLETVLNAESE